MPKCYLLKVARLNCSPHLDENTGNRRRASYWQDEWSADTHTHRYRRAEDLKPRVKLVISRVCVTSHVIITGRGNTLSICQKVFLKGVHANLAVFIQLYIIGIVKYYILILYSCIMCTLTLTEVTLFCCLRMFKIIK